MNNTDTKPKKKSLDLGLIYIGENPVIEASSCIVTVFIKAPKEEVIKVVNYWATHTDWVLESSSPEYLEFRFGTLRWYDFGHWKPQNVFPFMVVSFKQEKRGTYVTFKAVVRPRAYGVSTVVGFLGMSKTCNENIAHKFTNGVCYELSQLGYRVEPQELAETPKPTAQQLAAKIKTHDFTTKYSLLVQIGIPRIRKPPSPIMPVEI